jgi:spermidine synthase
MFGPTGGYPGVNRESSPYQKIDVVHDISGFPISDRVISAYSTKFRDEPDHPRNKVLFLNGDRQVMSDYEELYHEAFAHVPILLGAKLPERVLVMGAGDGILIDEILKHDGVREIIHVDLDPKMVEIARTDPVFTAMNRDSLRDPRVRLVLGDAYQYIRGSRDSFDAIYLDFPVPVDYNLSKLYSREFYHFVRERLTPGGFAVLDAPAIAAFTDPDDEGNQEYDPESTWEQYYHTIRMAGFETIVPFVSTPEIRNPAAIEILRTTMSNAQLKTILGQDAGDNTMTSALIMDFLRENVTSLQSGFIAMWADDRELRREWRDLGLPLHFLNEERFDLTISRPFPFPAEVDLVKVNSIMRPTFPTIPFWYTRMAW